ncbi:MAG TPA: hypothetical protein VK746_01440 [Candidatus Eisenbacteria bacterium]|nr:hypothetical protein [Candidatus Eisenbacteria bacterium]
MSARGSRPGLGPLLLLAAVVVAGLAAMGAGAAPAGERRAGTVLALDPQARTLTLDEFGANAERRALRVQVPREALVLLSQRNQAGRDVKDSFRDSAITLADVRVGDFVVIEMSDDPEVARLVMITLRRGAGS